MQSAWLARILCEPCGAVKYHQLRSISIHLDKQGLGCGEDVPEGVGEQEKPCAEGQETSGEAGEPREVVLDYLSGPQWSIGLWRCV